MHMVRRASVIGSWHASHTKVPRSSPAPNGVEAFGSKRKVNGIVRSTAEGHSDTSKWPSRAERDSRARYAIIRDNGDQDMIIDLRFVDAGYELLILGEYLKLLEADTPEIITRGRERIQRTQHDSDEEVNHSIMSHLEDRLHDGTLTRFLPAGVVLASWAIYEATVKEIADYLSAEKQLGLRMSGGRGGLLKQVRKYFKDSLGFELHPRGTDWERLERLSTLRNVLAHANGSLRDVRSKADRDRLRVWVGSTPGLSLEGHYILVSLAFAAESLRFVENLVSELTERVRMSFPLPSRSSGSDHAG